MSTIVDINDIQKIIENIINTNGKDIIKDPKRLRAFLEDYMRKYPSAKEISISLINNKIIERIGKKKHITDTEISNYISILHKNEGRDEQLVQIILQIWIDLLGNEINIYKIKSKIEKKIMR
jgi:alpha-L-fucosidase